MALSAVFLAALAAILAPVADAATGTPTLSIATGQDGSYNISVDGTVWLGSAPSSLCVAGTQVSLAVVSSQPASGSDKFGAWTGTAVSLATASPAANVTYTFKTYAGSPSIAVLTASFPQGVNTAGCGSNTAVSTRFPSFDTGAAAAPSLSWVSWKGSTLPAVAGHGLGSVDTNALDVGPAVLSDGSAQARTLTISTLDSHKIILQNNYAAPVPGPLTSLWSAARSDQVACLSALCTSEQAPQGNYTVQRVEGWGIVSAASATARDAAGAAVVRVGGRAVKLAPLSFAWSEAHADNWVGANATYPDATYAGQGSNGLVAAEAGVPGTVPLQVYSRAYSAQHTDWAAVASPEGLAWAEANGYTFQYTAGYVWASQPALDGSADSYYAFGLSAAIPAIPAAWSYSVLLSASYGGVTAGTYAHGAALQGYYSTYRLPSQTLSHVGYYTDDGAYYYVWTHWLPENRPWPAETGMVLVKENLWAAGVPVAYMQLDDWWYQGPFYFGNVRSVVNWTADADPRLFPNGLPKFADSLGLTLQLYTPFWADAYPSIYNMTESTAFTGTKLVVPEQSYAFFADYFDFGIAQTNGRFQIFEIDFLDSNFQGSASMFESVYAAEQWYAGMADAALERSITLQYCLPSATDIMIALQFPAVVQARASGDYVNTVANVAGLGGSTLLMGALGVGPSKDTLWTTSPQPPTSNDEINRNYTTQPHTELDCVLATLSMGPVGISDALNYTNVPLISQAFMSPTDGTLLRPSRPVSWVDSVFANMSAGLAKSDIRSTHAAVASARDGSGAAWVSHYIVAWQTTVAVTLGPTDLYPAPPAGAALAVRPHIAVPAGAAQFAGCTDGAPASPGCVTILPPGAMPTVNATGAATLAAYSLTAAYVPLPNGAYFLGDLSSFVHASPQRFPYVLSGAAGGGAGPAGITAGVRGTAGQTITVVAVDPTGIVRSQAVTLPVGGLAEVSL